LSLTGTACAQSLAAFVAHFVRDFAFDFELRLFSAG